MSISGTIPLSGLLASNAYTDGYPIIDSYFGIGSLREVPLQIDRDTIPPGRQRIGMLVFVQSSGSYFQLISTGSSILATVTNSFTSGASQYLTNSNWIQFNSGSGQIINTGSYIVNSQTSSMTVLSSSYAISASYAPSITPNYSFTSSYLQTSSYQIDSASFNSTIFTLSQSVQSDLTSIDNALSSIYPNIGTVSSNYILQSTDYTIIGDATTGGFTIYLPTASLNNKKIYNLKRVDVIVANNIIISSSISDLIYADTITTGLQLYSLESFTFHSDGINNRWIVI